MKFWDRKYLLTVTAPSSGSATIGSEYVENMPMRIKFTASKSCALSCNNAQIQLYNLSKETRALFDDVDCKVKLCAGYSGSSMPVIFDGIVSEAISERSGANLITNVSVVDGLTTVRDTVLNLSYDKNINTQKIIEDIAAQSGIERVEYSPSVSESCKDIPNGYSNIGTFTSVLTSVCDNSNLTWSIQNGTLQVCATNEPMTTAQPYELSEKSGLISMPQRLTQVATSTNINNANYTNRRMQIGWKAQYLLNANINPNDFVNVVSDEVTGTFRVHAVQYNGDNYGNDWTCTAELYDLYAKD